MQRICNAALHTGGRVDGGYKDCRLHHCLRLSFARNDLHVELLTSHLPLEHFAPSSVLLTFIRTHVAAARVLFVRARQTSLIRFQQVAEAVGAAARVARIDRWATGEKSRGLGRTTRAYSTVEGRWVSPDPAGIRAVNPARPQTWNRYAYVVSNPSSYIDPITQSGKVLLFAADAQVGNQLLLALP